MDSSGSERDESSRPSRDEVNPFITFRRYADSQFSSLLQTLVGLPSNVGPSETRQKALENDRVRQQREMGSWGGLLSSTQRDPADPFDSQNSKCTRASNTKGKPAWLRYGNNGNACTESGNCPRPELACCRKTREQDTSSATFRDYEDDNVPDPYRLWPLDMFADGDYSPLELEEKWPGHQFGEAFSDLCRTLGHNDNPGSEGFCRLLGWWPRPIDSNSDNPDLNRLQRDTNTDKDFESASVILQRVREKLDARQLGILGAILPDLEELLAESIAREETELDHYENSGTIDDAWNRLYAQKSTPKPSQEPGQCNVLATMTTTEQITDPNGKLHTKVVLRKLFSDGTEERSESTHISQPQLQKAIETKARSENKGLDQKEDKRGTNGRGWFWSD